MIYRATTKHIPCERSDNYYPEVGISDTSALYYGSISYIIRVRLIRQAELSPGTLSQKSISIEKDDCKNKWIKLQQVA